VLGPRHQFPLASPAFPIVPVLRNDRWCNFVCRQRWWFWRTAKWWQQCGPRASLTGRRLPTLPFSVWNAETKSGCCCWAGHRISTAICTPRSPAALSSNCRQSSPFAVDCYCQLRVFVWRAGDTSTARHTNRVAANWETKFRVTVGVRFRNRYFFVAQLACRLYARRPWRSS